MMVMFDRHARFRLRCEEWPWFARLVPVALIFVLFGPLVGGVLASLAIGVVMMPFRPMIVLDLPVMLLETSMLAYGFGAVMALITGLIVAFSRICGGRTTVATPIAAVALVYATGIALGESSIGTVTAQLLPVSSASVKFLLLPMFVASVACWRFARVVKLV